ncbi:MAG: UvrD-helicase domain-containing protein [Fusobacterium sp.]
MDSKIKALDKIYSAIEKKQNFVLQGGAGSGKTESLKKVIEYISKKYPEKKIACITHTNLAVDEIKSRVKEGHTICTIHSFLNDLIKNFKKNIHEVISEIFKIKKIDILEYKDYKKVHEKYASTLYTVKKKTSLKVSSKRMYDKNYSELNDTLTFNIGILNDEIEKLIAVKDYNQIRYNETKFNNFGDLSFGHDSLLSIASLLFKRYPLLFKILKDKYDFIFIDEYQDTNKEIIDTFLNRSLYKSEIVIGLFGDSMQSIYSEGAGDVGNYIKNGIIFKIQKEDNYRCSEQVIDFINQLRNDGLKQKIAFKIKDGVEESYDDRQGEVKLYYSVYNGERTIGGNPVDRIEYSEYLNNIINKVEEKNSGFKKLMLTNKSISIKVGFENLYNIFNERYIDVNEEIEKELEKLQLLDLARLSKAYSSEDYNYVISELKKSGFVINTIEDKKKINEILNEILVSDHGAIELLEIAFENKILEKSDSYSAYKDRKDRFLEGINEEKDYLIFKDYYEKGENTFARMVKEIKELNNEVFKGYEKTYKKERFYKELFSNKIKFKEIINYFSYLNEETSYITMHKTKGSGIKNVMIILDEYFWWGRYKFRTIFDSNEVEDKQKLDSQKLFYVACSRAIDNLICVKIVTEEEKENIFEFFKETEEI